MLTSRPLSRLVATEETRLDRAFMLLALLSCCPGSSNSGSASAKLLSALLGLAWPGALSELCRPSLPAAISGFFSICCPEIAQLLRRLLKLWGRRPKALQRALQLALPLPPGGTWALLAACNATHCLIMSTRCLDERQAHLHAMSGSQR